MAKKKRRAKIRGATYREKAQACADMLYTAELKMRRYLRLAAKYEKETRTLASALERFERLAQAQEAFDGGVRVTRAPIEGTIK